MLVIYERADSDAQLICYILSADDKLSEADLRAGLFAALKKLGPRKHVLAVPPDFTRFHSQAGLLTRLVHEFYGDKLTDILPALGTHTPMTSEQIHEMFRRRAGKTFSRSQLAHGHHDPRRSAGEICQRSFRRRGGFYRGRLKLPISLRPANTI